MEFIKIFMQKGIFFIILMGTIVSYSIAQDEEERDKFNYDISLNYGIFPSLTSDENNPELFGNIISAEYAYFFHNRIGFRTGFSSITNLEGTDGFYSVPLMFAFRSKVQRDFFIGGDINSFGDLIFQLILGLIPKHAEYNIGINLGYINPDNNLGLVSYNGGPFFKEGFLTQNRFYSSADAGLRLTYRIYRFGIVLSPSLSYVLTNNFEFYSEQGSNNGYSPDWFINMTIGLSYRF
jgi:hypothetical protein